jgi:Ras-related GTP-binding protein A/B
MSLSDFSNENSEKKILLMGNKGVGKTSMRSIIFKNFSAKDTFNIPLTKQIATSQVNFMGGNVLKILDCGGQEEFKKEYFQSKIELFDNVKILVFVVEAEKKKKNNQQDNNDDDILYFNKCVQSLEEHSPDAKIFVLIHKMDLICDDRKQIVFNTKKKEIEENSGNFNVTCFPTTIWEHSLFKAWSCIMRSITMNIEKLRKGLEILTEACGAEKIILFEKNSFLYICNSGKNEDEKIYESFSRIIKKMKLSFMKNDKQFINMKLELKNFSILVDDLPQIQL